MINTWIIVTRTLIILTTVMSSVLLIIPACEEKPPNEPLNTAVTDSAVMTIIPRSDSTSHKYTWRTWIFGDTPTSNLLDISAINENNAYVVGAVTIKDLFRGPGKYKTEHAMHWDGISWNYITIYRQARGLLYVEPDSAIVPAAQTIYQVWGEPPNNWTFSVSMPIYYDGTSFVTEYYFHRHPDSASAIPNLG
jgi:hypothetical protein